MMRNIIGQPKSSFNLRKIMDDGKILIVNLSKGRIGELNSQLLGMIFVMKFQEAALSRADIPEKERRDFCLYVDEFQNFSTDSFATIMSEARKYALNLIVANQFTTQLSEEIRGAVFGNMGTIISFRVGQDDVQVLAKYFQPLFDEDDLLRVANHNSIVRTLINGVPTDAFSMEGAPPPPEEVNDQLIIALKQLSATKYGHPKDLVAQQIEDRLETKSNPIASDSDPFGDFPPNNFPPGPTVAPKPKTPSFLDEWLAKRKNPMPANHMKQTTTKDNLNAQSIAKEVPKIPEPKVTQAQEVEFKIQRDNSISDPPSDI
jgi:hypothetical protein